MYNTTARLKKYRAAQQWETRLRKDQEKLQPQMGWLVKIILGSFKILWFAQHILWIIIIINITQ